MKIPSIPILILLIVVIAPASGVAAHLALPGMLAQTSVDSAITSFTTLIFKVLLLVALIMVLWAGYLIHDGKVREGLYALTGSFLLALASIIVHQLFSIAGN